MEINSNTYWCQSKITAETKMKLKLLEEQLEKYKGLCATGRKLYDMVSAKNEIVKYRTLDKFCGNENSKD